MLEGDKVLTEITCCLCLNDEESAFSANTIMKSLPLHEMVEIVIGVQVSRCVRIFIKFNQQPIDVDSSIFPNFIS